MDPDDDRTSMTAPRPLRRALARLEGARGLDPLGSAVGFATDVVGGGRRGDALRGAWLGHALHPLLTDLPLGCWLAAGVLDVAGGRGARGAATRLVGVGVLAAVPTAATGLAEYDTIDEASTARVAAVHAIGNAAVTCCYLASWRARRRGRHVPGVAWGLVGAGLAMATGYLGGHLSFARRVGTGERGIGADLVHETWSPPVDPIDDDLSVPV